MHLFHHRPRRTAQLEYLPIITTYFQFLSTPGPSYLPQLSRSTVRYSSKSSSHAFGLLCPSKVNGRPPQAYSNKRSSRASLSETTFSVTAFKFLAGRAHSDRIFNTLAV